MAELVSPGTSVPVIDESMYVAGQETCVPLIILATASEKQHPFSATSFSLANSTATASLACPGCAIGTYEHGVVRTVTSIRQSLELYGIPKFWESVDGVAHHGDARNEQGLAVLNHYLAQGNRALVVRANVNLDDSIETVTSQWTRKIDDAADLYAVLVAEYLRNYNETRGYVPLDPSYKTTLTAAEVKTLLRQALDQTAFRSYSFSSSLFIQEFLRDHGVPTAGYVEVQLNDSRGYIVGTDVTGLDADLMYQINIGVNGYAPNGQQWPAAGSVITIDGADALTYTQLINAINTQLAAVTFAPPTSSAPSSSSPGAQVVATLVNGRIRFTSALVGVTSEVRLTNAGLTSPLFVTTALEDVIDFLPPVLGQGNLALRVYTDYTYTTLNLTDSEFDGLDAAVDAAALIDPTFDVDQALAVLDAAALEYQFTREFRALTSLGANDAARRETIVQALVAELKQNEFIRNELYEHNIVLCPGFPEVGATLQEFVQSRQIKEEVFILGSVPMNVAPDGPGGLLEWHANSGIHTWNLAYYYPHSMMRNVDGKLILVDSTAIALRAFAYNDYVGQPWFAPAGVRRGSAPGVVDVGYVTGELGGPTEFVQIHLQDGHRDEMYLSAINPITFFPTTGIVVWGQKTTQSFASALDRVNVSRLIKYIKRGLRKASLPYVFEQNDYVTREQFRALIENYLNTIYMRRGLYDFAVLVDEANNTPERIDRNEMWGDVAIKPTKVAEFIYIPLHPVTTGADLGNGRTIDLSRR